MDDKEKYGEEIYRLGFGEAVARGYLTDYKVTVLVVSESYINMDQYRVKTDKKSGITDDPNDYSDDPKYIFNLLLSIINVLVRTVDLINQLPKFEVDESYYKDTKR